MLFKVNTQYTQRSGTFFAVFVLVFQTYSRVTWSSEVGGWPLAITDINPHLGYISIIETIEKYKSGCLT